MELLQKSFRKLISLINDEKGLKDFYKIRIINRSSKVVWLAKNTFGDLHDIIPPGRSLEIRLPLAQKIDFYAYKASDNLSVTGLDYCAKKEFSQNSIWVIQ